MMGTDVGACGPVSCPGIKNRRIRTWFISPLLRGVVSESSVTEMVHWSL
jgi:hypothetical protein